MGHVYTSPSFGDKAGAKKAFGIFGKIRKNTAEAGIASEDYSYGVRRDRQQSNCKRP